MNRSELEELYARMNEGELEVVAREAYDLTDAAKPLLQAEIARRGLTIPLTLEKGRKTEPAPLRTDFHPSSLDLVVARTIWKLEDARKAKEFLHGAGLPCYWGPDNIEDPQALDFEQGVELTVREEDLGRVQAGLAELFAGQTEEEGSDAEFSFACPQCQSPEIIFHDVDATAKFNWSCDACGHEWKDDGVG